MTDEHKEYLCELCDTDDFSRDALETAYGAPEHYIVRIVQGGTSVVCRYCIGYDYLSSQPSVIAEIIRQLK